MTVDLKETLSARQLLVLGLLGNLTSYLGRAPTRENFYAAHYQKAWPLNATIDELEKVGLIAEEDGCLVRRYSWEPAASLVPGRPTQGKTLERKAIRAGGDFT